MHHAGILESPHSKEFERILPKNSIKNSGINNIPRTRFKCLPTTHCEFFFFARKCYNLFSGELYIDGISWKNPIPLKWLTELRK